MAVFKSPDEYAQEFENFKKSKKKESKADPPPQAPKKKPAEKKHVEKKHFEKPKKKEEPYEDEYIRVDFELKPIHLERGIYVAVIAALVILLFFNPISDYVDFKKQVAVGNITVVEAAKAAEETQTDEAQEDPEGQDQPDQQPDQVIDQQPAEEDGPEQTEDDQETVQDEDQDSQEDDTVVVPGEITADNLELTIEDLIFEDKGNWAKITGVKVKLVNSGPKISPEFKAFIYDEQTKSYGVELERGSSAYDLGIPFGETLDASITLDKTASYNDPDTLISVIIKLYDSKTEEYVMSVKRDMRIDF